MTKVRCTYVAISCKYTYIYTHTLSLSCFVENAVGCKDENRANARSIHLGDPTRRDFDARTCDISPFVSGITGWRVWLRKRKRTGLIEKRVENRTVNDEWKGGRNYEREENRYDSLLFFAAVRDDEGSCCVVINTHGATTIRKKRRATTTRRDYQPIARDRSPTVDVVSQTSLRNPPRDDPPLGGGDFACVSSFFSQRSSVNRHRLLDSHRARLISRVRLRLDRTRSGVNVTCTSTARARFSNCHVYRARGSPYQS